jgi:hypothetical protein
MAGGYQDKVQDLEPRWPIIYQQHLGTRLDDAGWSYCGAATCGKAPVHPWVVGRCQ